jgi:hypothetical protein
VLLPYPSDEMIAWPVSTRVNTPKNDGPDLIQPWEGRAAGIIPLADCFQLVSAGSMRAHNSRNPGTYGTLLTLYGLR